MNILTIISIIKEAISFAVSKEKQEGAAELKDMQDYFINKINFIVSDYERQLASIKKYKKAHPENGVELDDWKQEASNGYQARIRQANEIRDLKETIIFLNIELDILKKKDKNG